MVAALSLAHRFCRLCCALMPVRAHGPWSRGRTCRQLVDAVEVGHHQHGCGREPGCSAIAATTAAVSFGGSVVITRSTPATCETALSRSAAFEAGGRTVYPAPRRPPSVILDFSPSDASTRAYLAPASRTAPRALPTRSAPLNVSLPDAPASTSAASVRTRRLGNRRASTKRVAALRTLESGGTGNLAKGCDGLAGEPRVLVIKRAGEDRLEGVGAGGRGVEHRLGPVLVEGLT